MRRIDATRVELCKRHAMHREHPWSRLPNIGGEVESPCYGRGTAVRYKVGVRRRLLVVGIAMLPTVGTASCHCCQGFIHGAEDQEFPIDEIGAGSSV